MSDLKDKLRHIRRILSEDLQYTADTIIIRTLDECITQVEPPKEQGAEPVAWMTNDGITIDDAMKQLLPERYSDYSQPLFTTPTSREKAMEEAGEEVIRAYRNFHEAIKQDTGRPYPWEPMVSAIEDWMAAKSTK